MYLSSPSDIEFELMTHSECPYETKNCKNCFWDCTPTEYNEVEK